MANESREARRKAMGRILKMANDALGARLPRPKPQAAPVVAAPEPEAEVSDEDAQRLIELYEAKQGEAPEA